MEGLRWWLVLLTAVLFSMSGCATRSRPSTSPADLASAQQLQFSAKSHPTESSIADGDVVTASPEERWGREMPAAVEASLSLS